MLSLKLTPRVYVSGPSPELTFPIASTSGEEKSYGETITDRDDDPDADLSDRAGGRRHDVDARLSRARRSANWPVLANVSRK